MTTNELGYGDMTSKYQSLSELEFSPNASQADIIKTILTVNGQTLSVPKDIMDDLKDIVSLQLKYNQDYNVYLGLVRENQLLVENLIQSKNKLLIQSKCARLNSQTKLLNAQLENAKQNLKSVPLVTSRVPANRQREIINRLKAL